jgi:prepilin signal peptidase PulO-like enzyme (type II secretory pathway)
MVGAVYGLLWTFGLGIAHFSDFKKSFFAWMKKPLVMKIRKYVLIGSVIGVVLAIVIQNFLIRIAILVITGLCFVFFYLYVAVKAIEKACMFRTLAPSELVEGDWPIDDIFVDGKDIFPKAKRLGFEAKDLEKLQKFYTEKKIGKIKVKHGVPFVPSFLFSLIVSLTIGNVLSFIIF